jgi:hypothetical protein
MRETRAAPGAARVVEQPRQTLGELARLAAADQALHAPDGLEEALVGERLEEIVHRVEVEGPKRVAVERRDEHDGW